MTTARVERRFYPFHVEKTISNIEKVKSDAIRMIALWSLACCASAFLASRIGIPPIAAAISTAFLGIGHLLCKIDSFTIALKGQFLEQSASQRISSLLTKADPLPFFPMVNLITASNQTLNWISNEMAPDSRAVFSKEFGQVQVWVNMREFPLASQKLLLETLISYYPFSKITISGLNVIDSDVGYLLASFPKATCLAFENCTFDDQEFLQMFPTFENSNICRFNFLQCPQITEETFTLLSQRHYFVRIIAEGKDIYNNRTSLQTALDKKLFELSCQRMTKVLRRLSHSEKTDDRAKSVIISRILDRLQNVQFREKLRQGKEPQVLLQIRSIVSSCMEEESGVEELTEFLNPLFKKRGMPLLYSPYDLNLQRSFLTECEYKLLFTMLNQARTCLDRLDLSESLLKGESLCCLGSLPISELKMRNMQNLEPLSIGKLRGINDSLQRLDLSGNSLTSDDLQPLVDLQNLRQLYLSDTRGFGTNSYLIFKVLIENKLELLSLENTDFREEFYTALCSYAQNLSLKRFLLATRCDGKRKLTICKTLPLNDSMIENIEDLIQNEKEPIKILEFAMKSKVSGNDFAEIDQKRLTDFDRLAIEEIDLSKCKYDSTVLALLSHWKNLHRLKLETCELEISKEGRSVKISQTQDVCAKDQLSDVWTFITGYFSDSIDPDSHQPAIRELKLTNAKLFRYDIGKICALCLKYHIENLDLSFTNLTKNDLEQEFDIGGERVSLIRLKSLKRLKIIGLSGGEELARQLARLNPSLTIISEKEISPAD